MEVVPAARVEDLLSSFDGLQKEICALSAQMLEVVGEIDAAGSWDEDDETALSHHLADRAGETTATAKEWVRMARALRCLPAIHRAHARGRLSRDKIRFLTRFATPETDDRLASQAVEMTPSRLYREVLRHERQRREEFEEDHQSRYLHTWWDGDRRFLNLSGTLPAEDGARVEQALNHRAKEMVLEDGPLYDPAGARRADALVELVCSSGDRHTPPTLVIHADAEVVAGAPRPGKVHLAEIESGAQLSDEAVRRLACDARIEWVIEADGRPVGIGRQGRTPPGWLARLLRLRDLSCQGKGCDRKRDLIAHHIREWPDGGPTDIDNLVLLCRTHHRLEHEGGGTITRSPPRAVRTRSP